MEEFSKSPFQIVFNAGHKVSQSLHKVSQSNATLQHLKSSIHNSSIFFALGSLRLHFNQGRGEAYSRNYLNRIYTFVGAGVGWNATDNFNLELVLFKILPDGISQDGFKQVNERVLWTIKLGVGWHWDF